MENDSKRLKRTDETFAEYFDHKPSAALQAMVDGLRSSEKQDDFEVNMETFGDASDSLCFGCAATVTVLESVGWKDMPDVVEECGDAVTAANELGDLGRFEAAVDEARKGRPYVLFVYMGKASALLMVNLGLSHLSWPWRLNTHNWKKDLPLVDASIARLRENGL
jgi:hypothetical protein